MRVLISGDFLPQKCNMDLFERGDVETLFGNGILNLYRSAAIRISNLEGPLTDGCKAIKKSGPCLKASAASVRGIKALGIDCVSIANNHIMDYGMDGYRSTLDTLHTNQINYVGAGNNASLARKPIILEQNGVKIGLYACAEYEFTIATEKRPGANAFDALYTLDDIQDLKSKTDYVIVLYHGLKECYRYPVPYVQKRCRRMIEKGADFVVCQHSHCIGCFEKWENGEILYGQGDFAFHRGEDEFRKSGLLVCVDIEQKDTKVTYIPVVRDNQNVRLANDEQKKRIMDAFEHRSQQIAQEEFVQDNYREFAAGMLRQYYHWSLGRFSIIPRALRKLQIKRIDHMIYKLPHKLAMLNFLRCEALRDMAVQGLLNEIGEDYEE